MFRHHQEIDECGRGRSVQTLDLPCERSPAPEGAAEAGRFYWEFLRRFGFPLLRVRPRPDGGVDVGVPGLLLLAFGPPAIIAHGDGFAARYPIEEGAVVQAAGRRQGYLQIGLGRREVSLAVEGYFAGLVGPKRNGLRVLLYLATQSAVHVMIARGYLGALAKRNKDHLPPI